MQGSTLGKIHKQQKLGKFFKRKTFEKIFQKFDFWKIFRRVSPLEKCQNPSASKICRGGDHRVGASRANAVTPGKTNSAWSSGQGPRQIQISNPATTLGKNSIFPRKYIGFCKGPPLAKSINNKNWASFSKGKPLRKSSKNLIFGRFSEGYPLWKSARIHQLQKFAKGKSPSCCPQQVSQPH